ncbi:MAG: branched-chain amino acid aminotransferase [Actinomycetaceae bacterium]
MPGLASAELPPAVELAARVTGERNPHPAGDAAYAEIMGDLSFGTAFTDHMVRATWTHDDGWGPLRLEPYGPLQLSPAASVLHYGQEVFEGLKAYRWADGSVRTFRPGFNAARLAHSARRLALPELPAQDVIASLAGLVAADDRWVPGDEGASLYLRPFMFSSEPFLGVRAGRQVEYLLIASPVGPYFVHGFEPVGIWVSSTYHRAGAGGMGDTKTGGNYAASLLPQAEAYEKGFEQVLFLDSSTNTYVDELGGMNLVVVDADGTVRTPGLTGTILQGGTRDSLLTLLAEGGREVREEPIALVDLLADIRSGAVAEIFACGTAAVVTPIGRLAGEDFDVTVGDGSPGPVTRALHAELTDIQYGRGADDHEWMYRLL